MTRSRLGLTSLAALACASLACTTAAPPELQRAEVVVDLCKDGTTDRVDVALTYLGAGGFLLRAGADALLTAPFYSNPDALSVGLGLRLTPDRERIGALLPEDEELAAVRAVLVGHAHYDHAMDLPVVLEKLGDVKVYGSETLASLLKPVLPAHRRVALNSLAADPEDESQPGEWQPVPGAPFRFLAIRSDHGPQVGPFTLFGGRVHEDRDVLPRSAYGWKEGLSLAFLIDVLRPDGSVALRLHYQDAPSHFPQGAPPDRELPPSGRAEARGIDAALVCVGAFGGIHDYPQSLLAKSSPRHIVLGHWEDFFRDPSLPRRVVRANDFGEFRRRLQPAIDAGAAFTLPDRGVTIRFRACRTASPGP